MIVVEGHGRLGNQFFQEVFCRYAQLVLKAKIAYNGAALRYHSSAGHESRRVFAFDGKYIGPFGKLMLFGPDGVELPPRLSGSGKWKEQHSRWVASGQLVFEDPAKLYDSEQSLYGENVKRKHLMLDGYFSHHYYFDSVKALIPGELVFRSPLVGRNLELAEKMRLENSVAIHIRQGDYKTIPGFQLCSPEYYARAIEIICQKVADPVFYVFSEEPVAAFLPPKLQYTFVDWNTGAESFRDVQLMTCCRHLIIANSTFSYMAALLGANPDTIVIQPEMYNAHKAYDFTPPSWIKI